MLSMNMWNLKLKTAQFIISPKKIYKDISLAIHMLSLYPKNDKRLIKKINKWKDIPCSWIEKSNIAKRFISVKAFYTFKSIPMKNTNILLH